MRSENRHIVQYTSKEQQVEKPLPYRIITGSKSSAVVALPQRPVTPPPSYTRDIAYGNRVQAQLELPKPVVTAPPQRFPSPLRVRLHSDCNCGHCAKCRVNVIDEKKTYLQQYAERYQQ